MNETSGNWESRYGIQRLEDFVSGPGDVVIRRTRALIEGDFAGSLIGLFGDISAGKSSLLRLIQRARNCHQTSSSARCGCGECRGCRSADGGGGDFSDLFVRYTPSDRHSTLGEIEENISMWAQWRGGSDRRRGQFVLGFDDIQFMAWLDFGWLQAQVDRFGGRGILFALATSSPNILPPSLLSRCECLHLRLPSLEQLTVWFTTVLARENITYEAGFPRWLALKAERRPRMLLNLGWQLSRITRHFSIVDADRVLFTGAR